MALPGTQCWQAPREVTAADCSAIEELRRDLDSQGSMLARLMVETENQTKQRESKAGSAVWSATELRVELAAQRALWEELQVDVRTARQDWRNDSSRLKTALRALG